MKGEERRKDYGVGKGMNKMGGSDNNAVGTQGRKTGLFFPR